MCPQTQTEATAVMQAHTSDTKHLEDPPKALGFKVSFTSTSIKQGVLPQHLIERFCPQLVMTKRIFQNKSGKP